MNEELVLGNDGLGVVGEDNAVCAFLQGGLELWCGQFDRVAEKGMPERV